MNGRAAKVAASLPEAGVDAVFTLSPENRRYVTDFTGSSGYALVTADGVILLTDSRYTEQARMEARGVQVEEHAQPFYLTLKERLRKLGVCRLGFEAHAVTHRMFLDLSEALEGVELVPADRLIERAREIKDPGEIKAMREAARIADEAFSHILGFLRPGLTEREVALELEVFMRRSGASGASFDIIVASGERSALPHGVASDRAIGRGEFVKMDFGAFFSGYASDITRTVGIGPLTDRHKEVYGVVKEAQQRALDGIRPGIAGRDADALARDAIAAAGYGERFGHSLGHGLGLAVHEGPRLGKQSEDILRAGATVTVEPGIYIPGFGGVRIEDDILITSQGNERFTQSTKELVIL